MKNRACTLLALVMLLPAVSYAQVDISVDTVTMVVSSQIMYDGQLVDYFQLHTNDNDLRFIEDSAYIKLTGFISGLDTANLPDAIVWMKTNNPMIGDSWDGMIPEDSILPTHEMIAGQKQVTVGAGMFTVWQVDVWRLDGEYIGEKWWMDGVGLIGWSFSFCNETFGLELLDYAVAPSGDFWPHTVGDQYVIASIGDFTTTDADYAVVPIVVDGNGADWAGYVPVVQDPSGDDTTAYNGCDIKDLYVAADDTYLYLMVDFWDGAPDIGWAAASSPAYQFILDEYNGGAYGFDVDYVASSWTLSGINLDTAGADVTALSVLEVRVPLVNIGYYGMELPGYYIKVGDGIYDASCYNTVRLPAYCPIAVSGDVNGDYGVMASDIIYLVNYVLKGGPDPIPCPAAGDATGDGEVKSSDIIYLVNYVFKAGPYPTDVCSLIPGVWSCP